MCNTGLRPMELRVLEEKHMAGVSVRTVSSQRRLDFRLIVEVEPKKCWIVEDSSTLEITHLESLPLSEEKEGAVLIAVLTVIVKLLTWRGFQRGNPGDPLPRLSLTLYSGTRIQNCIEIRHVLYIGLRDWWHFWPLVEETY